MNKNRQLVSTPASNIVPESVIWLWADRIPKGMLTLLVGDPGLGKSLLACSLAAKVTTDPDPTTRGDVLMLTAEDSPGVTVRPRLEAAGADLDRVHVLQAREDGVKEGLRLPDDVHLLVEEVERTAAKLVIVDPLSAHLPARVNTWQDQSVRLALRPLHQLADERGCTMLVIAHLNKNAGQKSALYRVGGSIGLPAAARSVLLLGTEG